MSALNRPWGAGPCLLALLVFAPSVEAQRRLYEEVEVRRLEVPVTVLDRRGRPVEGLPQEAFEVLIDGEPTPILGFTASQSREVSARLSDEPTTEAPGEPINLAFFVDPSNVDPQRGRQTIERLREVFEQPGSARLMVVEHRLGEMQVRHALEDSPALAAASLDGLAMESTSDGANELKEIVRSIERLLSHEIALTRSSREAHVQLVATRINAYAAEVRQDVVRTSTSLGRLVDSMSGLPGRSAIFYVGAGLAVNPGVNLLDALRSAYLMIPSEGSTGSPPASVGLGGGGDNRELRDLGLYAAVLGVEIYSIDVGSRPELLSIDMSRNATIAAGAARPGEELLAPELGSALRIDLEGAMELLAQATGGRTFGKGEDFAPTLDALVHGTGTGYLLVVEPGADPSGSDGSIRSIGVRVDRRRVEVSHRESFRFLTDDERAMHRLSSALLYPVDVNPLGIEVDQEPAIEGATKGRITLRIRIPLESLAVRAQGGAHQGLLSIYVSPGNANLEAHPVKKLVLPVNIPNEQLFDAMGQTIDHRTEVELTEGQDRIVVAVRDDLASLMSVVTVTSGPPGEKREPGGQ